MQHHISSVPGLSLGWSALLVALTLFTVASRPLKAQTFAGWVGLFDSEMLGWLENENRLSSLCADAGPDLDDCYVMTLAPLVRVLTARVEPSHEAERVGELLIVANPGRGLTAHVRASDDTQFAAWRPDLYDTDWGYGPYFHQTFIAQYRTWFLLPKGPFATPFWLEVPADELGPRVLKVTAGDILELDETSWYVIRADQMGLTLRPEQPADMWCEEGEPPPIEPLPGRRFDRAELLDTDGHLRIRPKYLRGC